MHATSRKRRSHRWIAAGLAAIALLAACSRQTPASHPPEPGDVAVATVDGQTVWASDVRREAATQGLIGQGDPLDISTDVFHRVLDEVIDQKLLAAEALKHHLENDPVARQRLAAARERILADMLISRLVEQAVSESSIRGLYDQQVQLSHQGEEFHARQIVVASPTDADAIKKQITGGVAFDALAMEHSVDADTRYNGGDLGYFTIDVMPPAYAAALAGAKPGDIVGPFKSEAGWVLLKVEDRRPEQPISLDAARPQIVNFLTDEQVGDLLKRLRGNSHIQVMIPPANPNEPGALREPASAPPTAEAPASAAPLSAAAPSGAPTFSATPPSAAPPAPITLAPPAPASVILHMAPGAEPALPHLRSPPPASGPAVSRPTAPPPPPKPQTAPLAKPIPPKPAAPVKSSSPPAKPAPKAVAAKSAAPPARSAAPPSKAAVTKPAPAKFTPPKPTPPKLAATKPAAPKPKPASSARPSSSARARPEEVIEMPYAKPDYAAPPRPYVAPATPAPSPRQAPASSGGPIVTAPGQSSP